MSENIPESVPTSADRRSHRPTKKRALTPVSQQSAQVEALFANPDREITVPAGGPKARTLAPPPEIVANVQGSSAGAGSGEFHVYKASRRREYERLRLMDEEVEREEKNREFETRRDDLKAKDEEKLSKNQAKRAKMKARKEKAEMLKKMGKTEGADEERNKTGGQEAGGPNPSGHAVKRKLGPAKMTNTKGADNAVAAHLGADEDGGTTEQGGIMIHDDD